MYKNKFQPYILINNSFINFKIASNNSYIIILIYIGSNPL